MISKQLESKLLSRDADYYQKKGGKIQEEPTITKENRKEINKHREIKINPVIMEKPMVDFDTNSKFNCSICYANNCCRGLCPPMEWLVQQTEVEPSKEEPCIDPFVIRETMVDDAEENDPGMVGLSTTKKILLMAIYSHIDQIKVAKHLNISRQYVNKVVTKYLKQCEAEAPKTG